MPYFLLLVILMNKYIFENQFFLGYISKVNAYRVVVHIPSSNYMTKFYHFGERFHGGVINSYIVVEGESIGFIGKIVAAEIPETERLELSSAALKHKDFHPFLHVELLSVFDYHFVKFEKSVNDFPDIGAKVYMASDRLVNKYLTEIELHNYSLKTEGFAKLINSNFESNIDFSFQSLFSRHAAIVGATGSGKSWTTSSLICNLLDNNQKVLLIDATGEYEGLAEEYCIENEKVVLGKTHILPYEYLTTQDIFHLLTPAPNAQAPKLREAIRSLKLLEKVEDKLCDYINETGDKIKTIVKEGKNRDVFLQILNSNTEIISTDNCNFDIRGLALQVQNECIYPSGLGNASDTFGREDPGTLGHCTSLITRIESLLNDSFYNEIFDFQQVRTTKLDLIKDLTTFINGNIDKNFLYIDVSSVPFSFEIREIVIDIIGQNLLKQSRKNMFKEQPLTVFVDEAHQFLNKSVTTEQDTKKLEAFENIAKEGRKYGLFLCLTTQLPRDIPIGILSQIGTFVTHRLINQRDKEIVMHSLPSISENIINYLPALGQGEAIVSSNEIKDTLYIKVNKPKVEPKSNTPKYT